MSTTRFNRRRTSIGLAAAATVALLVSPLSASGSAPSGERLATGTSATSKAGVQPPGRWPATSASVSIGPALSWPSSAATTGWPTG